jgi:hypothetical protein
MANEQRYKAAAMKCLSDRKSNTLSYPSIRTSSSLLLRMCFRSLRVKPEGVVLLSLQKCIHKGLDINVPEQGDEANINQGSE